MKKMMISALLIFICASWALAQDDYHKIEVAGGYLNASTNGFAGDQFNSNTPTYTQTFGNFTSTVSGFSSVTGNPDSRKRKNQQGFETSVVYNFSRYFGVKFDVSGHYGTDKNTLLPGGGFRSTVTSPPNTTPETTFGVGGCQCNSRLSQYNFLGGIQFKNNSKEKKIKPFAHFLLGTARQKTKFTDIDQRTSTIIGGNSIKNNSFTYAIGGGLDIRAGKHIDVRVIQFDYNPVNIHNQKVLSVGDSLDLGITLPNGSQAGQVISRQNITIPNRRQNNFRIGFGIVFH